MRNSELYRSIAAATGESVATIEKLGFSLLDETAVETDDACFGPNVVDWDEVEVQRAAQLLGSDQYEPKAA
ncbi:hypothetical protein GC197_14535 [bacterium]|nr:hypothetical protein [bacterium]